MPQFASKGLLVRAIEVEKCRVFSPGDELALCGREVLGGCSCNHCAYLLKNLCPVLSGMEKGIALGYLGLDPQDGTYLCKGFDCEGRFECVSVEPGEMARVRNAIKSRQGMLVQTSTIPQTPPPVTGSATATAATPPQSAPVPSPRLTDTVKATLDTDRPFLDQLPQELAERLLASGTRRMLAGGETVLEEGQPGQAVYFIERGEVAVEKKMKDGSVMQLARLGAGEVFGEMALMSGEPCNATVRTLIKTRMVLLNGEELDRVMGENPQLHRWFSHLFASRMRATNVRLEDQLTRGMNGRLSMIGLLDLLQTLLMARKSGILTLRRGSETGTIRLKDGQMKSVMAGNLAEENAFQQLCCWTDGLFSFQEGGGDDIPVNIHRDTMQIMMDAARMRDEQGR